MRISGSDKVAKKVRVKNKLQGKLLIEQIYLSISIA